MSDLISIGRSGVLAYQGALKTIGENVTNADTDGYSRRTVVLKEQNSYQGAFVLNRSGASLNGVQTAGVARVWDQYKASNAWTANSDANSNSTRAQYLSNMESLLNDSDSSGVGTRLTAIFNSATQLAANPADTSLRQAYLASIGDAAGAFNRTASNLSSLSNTISTQASLTVDQTNTALDSLAKLNLSLRTAPADSTGRAQLEDQRDQLLGTISGAVAINTTFAADGSVSVRLNDSQGPLLVSNVATSSSTIAMQTASDGRISVAVSGVDGQVTAATPTGGSMAGMIDSANTNAGRRAQLDGLATQLADLINTNQQQGLTDAGTAGQGLLAGTDAASLKLSINDPTQVAAASQDGTANGNLLALTATRSAAGNVEAKWKAMVTDQSLLVASANTASSAASARKDNAYTALDQTTGVDLNNEAAELLRFQQAYSASAKIISAARETFQDILNLF